MNKTYKRQVQGGKGLGFETLLGDIDPLNKAPCLREPEED